MILDRLSVKSRFLIVLMIGFVCQACISFLSLAKMKHALIQARTSEVKHLLETAYSTVTFYHDQASKGLISDAAARQAARSAVRAMHYDGSNYYFIWTLNGTGVAHGSHPEWEGLTFIDSPKAKENPVVSYMVGQLIAVARTPAGQGVTTYKIPRAGQTLPLNKIAYSRLFEPWGWSIGTGAYVDDIDATFRKEALSLLWIFGALIALTSLLTYSIGNNLARALKLLAERITKVANGVFDGDVPETGRRDEVGVMARALLVLRDNSRDAVELRLDQLTGLPNRKLLMDRIQQAIGASSRNGQFGGVMLIDLDKFKAINDTHGHDAGDLVLKQVAHRLSGFIRKCDTVARLGGDEFVAVISSLGGQDREAAVNLEIVAEKMKALLRQPCRLGGLDHLCTASIGLTLFQGDPASIEDLLKQADLAMYDAKHAGSNTCRFFDPHMQWLVQERERQEEHLRRAIAEQQFELFYQPQVGADGCPHGAEALIRWRHPQRGLVPPDQFIPLAEETGLILPLGRWVLETACRQLAAWASRPETAALKIAVNVSACQFHQATFVEQVLGAVRSSGADPGKLELELTESLLVQNLQEVIGKMTTLKSHGIHLSLDDFGTGYSSLSYLRQLPLNKLKIDKSFMNEILSNRNDAAIVLTIIALAKALNLDIIAEGVETRAQQEFLANSGCLDYQGYLFSRPLPVGPFEAFVAQAGRHCADLSLASEPAGEP